MLRSLIAFIATFVVMGGGILVTIFVVKQLNAPALVAPGVVAIIAATFGVGLVTAPGGTLTERYRWFARMLEGSGSERS
jgi:hypothetical protein